MESQVIIRPRQRLTAPDLTNMQVFAADSLDHVVLDAIGSAKRFVGLLVTQASATEISIATGRLYGAGKVYARVQASSIDLLSLLPSASKRKVAIVTWGVETDTDIQQRTFEIDPVAKTYETDDIAMRRDRLAQIDRLPGAESADPQLPAIDAQYLHVATVTLTTTGIENIEMIDANRLVSVQDLTGRVALLEGDMAALKPLVSTSRSDIAALASQIGKSAPHELLSQLVVNVANLMAFAEIEDGATSYDADRFLTTDETDTASPDLDCRVEEGVRFNWDNAHDQALALFNPLDPAVKQTGALVLPKYDEETRISVDGYSGDVEIAQYTSQAIDFVQKTMSRQRIRYGESRQVCTNNAWWQSGQYDPTENIFIREGETFEVISGDPTAHSLMRLRQFWVDRYEYPYWERIVIESSVNGASVSQTFLNGQAGWVTGFDLTFTDVGADGDVTLLLCEATASGVPDLTKVIAKVTKAAGDLAVYPQKTWFGLGPVFLQQGKRYAWSVVTLGDHRIATADKDRYLGGTMFVTLDGAFHEGNLDKNLMFDAVFARFDQPRTVVELASISLSGGITDLDILAEMFVPEGTDFIFEIQPEGSSVWTPIGEVASGNTVLYNFPAQVKLRAVFLGTADIAPGLKLTDSLFRATRPKTTLKHVSTEVTLTAASQDITLNCYLEWFDEVHHDCTLSLIVGGSPVAASVVEDVAADNGIRRKATFSLGAPTTNFTIVIEGTTDSALRPWHVNDRVYHAF